MAFTLKLMTKVGTPCVVLVPHHPKMGHRLPADMPVVVVADYIHPGDSNGMDRLELLRWLHWFVTLATYPARMAVAPVYVAWQNGTLEEIDLETCPRYET